MPQHPPATNETQVRLDKWLWAARFFKTRSIARTAVEGGKVHYNGSRIKPSKLVQTGAQISITQIHQSLVIDVLALSDKRRSAPQAALLYQETAQSCAKRQKAQSLQHNLYGAKPVFSKRPDKKQRRKISQFIRQREIDSIQ